MYKVELFRATVESILQYGSESWTLTSLLTKRLDGTYTKLLRAALNIHWRDHQRNVNVYGNIPKISETIRKRKLSLATVWEATRSWRTYFSGNQHVAKDARADQRKPTYINWRKTQTWINKIWKKTWKTDKNGKMSYHQNGTKRQKELIRNIHVASVVKTSLKTFGQYNAQTVYFGYTELVWKWAWKKWELYRTGDGIVDAKPLIATRHA